MSDQPIPIPVDGHIYSQDIFKIPFCFVRLQQGCLVLRYIYIYIYIYIERERERAEIEQCT